MNDVAELNEQIARIKGWRRCAYGPSCGMWVTDPATGMHSDGDFTQPAMWAGLLVELMDGGWLELYHAKSLGEYRITDKNTPGWLCVGTAPDLGLAICRAYVERTKLEKRAEAAEQEARRAIQSEMAAERERVAAEQEVARLKADDADWKGVYDEHMEQHHAD